MKYCDKCLQPDTRPGLELNNDNICPGCQYFTKTDDIDWDKRNEELNEIISFGKKTNVSGYDCIIGVSGGKDSLRQAIYVKEELKLKPLLVCCVYPPEQQTEIGAYNLGNLIRKGFDAITIAPAPKTSKKLMKKAFLDFGNCYKATEMALYACIPIFSIAYQIPLSFLGENPAIQLGDLGVGSLDWNANKMKNTNTIVSGPTPLLHDGINKKDTLWYHYPSDEEMNWANLKIVYLGYFWPNFNKVENGEFAIARGLDIRKENPLEMGFLHPFESLDEDFIFVNQMLKYLKYGFGKITDEVCEEIRNKRMTREEAIPFVDKFDGRCAEKYIQKFCDYIGITIATFWKNAEKYVNKDILKKDSGGRWVLLDKLKHLR